jgi:CO/xanthine dehydrogenase FAD-binding subunit
MAKFKYASPGSLEQTWSLLREYGPDAALLAGGTDLLADIRSGQKSPKLVIALRRMRELSNLVAATSGGLSIGALATLSDVAHNASLRSQFPAVAEAAARIGSEQIRNWGTMAGNLCNASPAADTIPALLIYDASVNLIGPNGRRQMPVEAFINAPRRTALLPGEIVESIFLPCPPAISGSSYVRFSRREGADLAIVGVAALTSAWGAPRIALGAVGPTAFRAYAAEALLLHGFRDPAVVKAAVAKAAEAADPISDVRASRDYRLHLIQVLTAEALKVSHERIARGGCQCQPTQ